MNKLSDFILNYIIEDSPAKKKKAKKNRELTKSQKERHRNKSLTSEPVSEPVSKRGTRTYSNRNPIDKTAGEQDSGVGTASLLRNNKNKSTNLNSSSSQSNSKGSSFWSKAGNHISNHKVGYGIGAGAVTAAGIGAAIHHHNKNKGILNKIKNNPGKAAGASLAALGAGAGAAALIRYLRKKRKQ